MPNRNYQTGVRFEYERKKFYESMGLVVLRSSGSHGLFDLIAVDPGGTVFLIQCKKVATLAQANRLCKAFKKKPPLTPGRYYQVLDVKVPKHGIVSTFVDTWP